MENLIKIRRKRGKLRKFNQNQINIDENYKKLYKN